ncbi:hypothetical protein [Paenibacillus glufosinatiresistens]|uniref:hypothetical protein n=1 Tax=Paenibacillus glufosinatiresistens TaxID=3070657 RepID=UPI00286EA5B4|nr:hypothetical protein [Paenibacillus sp. YX.27]
MIDLIFVIFYLRTEKWDKRSGRTKETATNAYQMTQQAYTAVKQMSPEDRARVLGEKAGELAVDAVLTKGAGALGKEALNATLETAGTLAQKARELLPKPGAVLTTPEGIRIPVSEAEADWVRKIEAGVEGAGNSRSSVISPEMQMEQEKLNLLLNSLMATYPTLKRALYFQILGVIRKLLVV